jgi:hypothetical protein
MPSMSIWSGPIFQSMWIRLLLLPCAAIHSHPDADAARLYFVNTRMSIKNLLTAVDATLDDGCGSGKSSGPARLWWHQVSTTNFG